MSLVAVPADPSPVVDRVPANPAVPEVPAKISAYYSLVFPNITFFLQTLTVTIGRRCLPPTSTSLNGTDTPSSSHSPVDVDLGPLKSVSRLHARIEYEEEEARFVLVVIGRNGAWVDGVWSGAGSRVPLGERSQIQIASRTFHFVLPPPAALEDSPSPSSVSSMQRARSPSVDITSISPPSSLPSHSPSPRTAPALPPLKPSRSPDPQLPNSNAIPRIKAPVASTPTSSSSITAPTSKKRKKASQPPPKPDVMPPKPPFTYAQLCYRAIKSMGGKATLQDICGWMMDNFDWYRYNEGAGWENSVRHNLSSGRAFKKMERSTGEHGKGFFWSIDAQYEHMFEEQDARAAAQAQSTSGTAPACGKDGTSKGFRKKDKVAPLDQPLKRSVKRGMGPLPPPLTSAPLVSHIRPDSSAQALGGPSVNTPSAVAAGGVDAGTTAREIKSESTDPPRSDSTALTTGLLPALASVASTTAASGAGTPTNVSADLARSGYGPASHSTLSSSSASSSPFATLPPSVCLPIVVGPVPSSHPSSGTPDPPPIVLHNNTLVLSPIIFSSLAPEQLKALEEMGAQKALEVLQAHIVRYLKERMGKKKRKKAAPGAVADKAGTKSGKSSNPLELSSPFTTTPLPSRTSQSTPISRLSSQTPTAATTSSNLSDFYSANFSATDAKETVPSSVCSSPPVPVPLPDNSKLQTFDSSIVIVDNDDREERASKRRKLGNGAVLRMEPNYEASATQTSQVVDEDIEVDVC